MVIPLVNRSPALIISPVWMCLPASTMTNDAPWNRHPAVARIRCCRGLAARPEHIVQVAGLIQIALVVDDREPATLEIGQAVPHGLQLLG
jgi:hypothetical protein